MPDRLPGRIPHPFCRSKDSIFYEANRTLADYECDFLLRTQREDGAWSISWSWGAYPEAWPVARAWWEGTITVNNLLFLRGMGRL